MDTITITINRSSVLKDMKIKSHAQAAGIADPTERYLVELGSDKQEEAYQCITDASTEVSRLLQPFIASGTKSVTGSDTYETGDFTYNLGIYETPPNFTEELTRAIHAYIVDSALSKYYISVSRGELSKAHASKLDGEIAVIRHILYYRPMP